MGFRNYESVQIQLIERTLENFVLIKAKNVGIAIATARLFNAEQSKICRV